jgi:glucose/arabinose dehydrogenase
MRHFPGFLPILSLFGLLIGGMPAEAMTVTPAVENLSLPVRLAAPTGDARLFVVEKNGRIKVFDRDGTSRGIFLDISALVSTGGERGLLGLAFAPDYQESGRFFVNYTDVSGDTQVVRYNVDPVNPDLALAGSASAVIQVSQPFSNHNGGHLEFGPDGMLYVGLGDGGSGGDPNNNAQNGLSLLGKMLRLDVSGSAGYAIPEDNPFVGQSPRDEIWATGLRNPWCFGFDRLSGNLWIADVGQNVLEEINVQPVTSTGGENYGWRLMEGTDCYNPSSNCNDGSLTLPVFEYTHGGNPYRCSISGGFVYRGNRVSELEGRYLFADYCSLQIWALDYSPGGGEAQSADLTDLLTPPQGYQDIVGFGQDSDGELYIIDMTAGTIFRIMSDASGAVDLPQTSPLQQNVPNPFNPETTITFNVPEGSAGVRLEVLDVRGHLVRTLVEGPQPVGSKTVAWNGTDTEGRVMPAGVYFYRLRAGHLDQTRKMVLLK